MFMQIEAYNCQPVEMPDLEDTYGFTSQGPKGPIEKRVHFQKINEYIGGSPVVNLAFGDLDEENKKINDSSISNNGDKDKILATVAYTAIDYINKKGKFPIIVKGSSPARTRLYQMALNAYRKDVEPLFTIFGLIGTEWELFASGKNYKMFLFFRR